MSVQLDLFGRAPEVIVDVHEVNRARDTSITLFISWLKARGVYYQVKKLDVGDLVLPGGYVIERKTVRDFLNSLFGRTQEGRPRLREQLEALANSGYEHPILLIEGGLMVRKDYTNKCIFIPKVRKQWKERLWWVVEEQISVSPRAWDAAIESIREMGIEVILTSDERHGAEILKRIYLEAKGQSLQQPERKYPVVRTKPKLKEIADWQLFFLCGLPGISTARALRILERYKTPFEAIKNVRRWHVEVDGIGPVTTEQVIKVLFTPFDPQKSRLLRWRSNEPK